MINFRPNFLVKSLSISHYYKAPFLHIQLNELRKLQIQTLPNVTSPKGKFHPFSKIAVTFEQEMRFGYPMRFKIF